MEHRDIRSPTHPAHKNKQPEEKLLHNSTTPHQPPGLGHQTPTTIPRTTTQPHFARQPTTQQNPQAHPPHAPAPHLQRRHVAHISTDARGQHPPTSQGAEQSTHKGRTTIPHALHHQPHHQTRHAQKTNVGLPRPTTHDGGGMEQSPQQPVTSHTNTNP